MGRQCDGALTSTSTYCCMRSCIYTADYWFNLFVCMQTSDSRSALTVRTLAQPVATFPKPSMLPSKTPNSSRSIPSSPPYYTGAVVRGFPFATCPHVIECVSVISYLFVQLLRSRKWNRNLNSGISCAVSGMHWEGRCRLEATEPELCQTRRTTWS